MKGFKASWLGEIQRLMLSNWWHRDSYYNPLSQNSEHGLPTERRDGEVDWSEVTRQDQIIDQDRQTVGGWGGGVEWRYTEVASENRRSETRRYRHPRVGGRGATWFQSCIAQWIQRWEENWFLKRGRERDERPVQHFRRSFGSAPHVTVPPGWLHSEIWLSATWGKGPLVQIFLHGFPCFTGCSGREGGHSKLYFCSCFLLVWMPNTKHTYEQDCRHPGSV